MKDRLWQAVYNALRPLLNDADVVTAPRGDWPTFPCAAIYDELIDVKNCTILRLPPFDKLLAAGRSWRRGHNLARVLNIPPASAVKHADRHGKVRLPIAT